MLDGVDKMTRNEMIRIIAGAVVALRWDMIKHLDVEACLKDKEEMDELTAIIKQLATEAAIEEDN